jgi:hypothetical protein
MPSQIFLQKRRWDSMDLQGCSTELAGMSSRWKSLLLFSVSTTSTWAPPKAKWGLTDLVVEERSC